jgi:WD40 repeat protein/serine/threonine protein kinase
MSNRSPLSSGARERDVFLAALEKEPADQAAFLDAACGGDLALRRRVEDLLRTQQAVSNFPQTAAVPDAKTALAGQAVGPGGTNVVANVTEKPGDCIGRYKLLQQIGEGGCGVVYMAEQEEHLRRRVALKVIKLGMDTKQVIARFESERQALALMDHPNIAKVLDAGATETGRPYFVMELVRGVRITEYCDQHRLPIAERLKLFIQVCLAIQHAHQKGVIHRDIKPSNILVTLHDGTPVPKVIDFGIAKATERRLTDKTLFTEFTAFIGTPAYMSPEQAEMSGLDIDTRSDIYALGVLLYELLTGKTPFDGETLLRAGLDECRRTIREQEPVRPSSRLATLVGPDLTTAAHQRGLEAPKLIHLLSGDLDWIAMKCLEKDRTRRYPTANGLATDVQCYLDGEPVLARPPSNVYRFKKMVHRHRRVFAAVAAITVTLLGGIAVSTWEAIRAIKAERSESQLRRLAEHEQKRAEEETTLARANEYVAHMNLAWHSLKDGNYGRAFRLLEQHRPRAGEPDLRGFEWRYLWQLCQGDAHIALPDQGGPVESVAFSPSGDLLAVGTRDKVNIWNVRTRSLVTSQAQGAFSLAFLPDGKALVTASRGVRVWRTSDWTEQGSWQSGRGPGFAFGPGPGPGPDFGPGITLSSDASRLAAPTRQGITVRNTASWEEIRHLSGASAPDAFSPDANTLATDADAGITLWPLQGATNGLVLEDSTNVFIRGFGPGMMADRAMAFSPDGKSFVAARNTLSAKGVFILSVWDTTSGKEIAVMPEDPEHIEHTGIISSLAFSPDGRTLATASMDHSVRLWDVAKRQPIAALQGHLNEVMAVIFAPDGQSLVSGARGGGVKIWPTQTEHKEDFLPGFARPLAFSKDGQTLACLSQTNSVLFLDLNAGAAERQLPLETQRVPMNGPRMRALSAVAVSGDLRTLAQGLEDGSVKLWNTETLEARTLKASDRPVELVALSPDGRMLITGGRGGRLHAWDLRSNTNSPLPIEAMHAFFSPDGRTLAAFQRSFLAGFPPGMGARTQTSTPATNSVLLWDVPTASLRTSLVMDNQPGIGTAFSPDSSLLATANFDVIRLWDVGSGKLVGACTGHKQSVWSVAFAPDGKTLVSASDDSTLKLWNVATQQELLTVRRLGGTMRNLLFSPDGRWLVGSSGFPSRDGGLRLYQAPLLTETDSASATRPLKP